MRPAAGRWHRLPLTLHRPAHRLHLQSLAYHQLWGATPDAAALAGAMQQAGLNPYAALQQPFWPPVSAAAGGALPAGQLGWQQLAQGAAAAQQLAQGATAAQQLPAGMQYGLPGNMHHEQAGLLRQQGPSGQDYAALLQASAAQAVAAAAQQAQGGTGAPAPRRKPPPPPPATTAVQAPPEQLLQPPQPSGQRGVGEAPVQPLQQEPRAEPGANFSRQQQEQEPGAPAAATAPAGVQGEQGGMKPEPQGQQQVGPSAPAWDGEAAELQSPSVDEAMLAASALKALQGDGGFLGGSGLVGPAGPAPLPPRPPQQGGGGGGAEGSAGRRRKAAPTKLSWQGQPAGGDGSDGGQASDGEWVPSWAPSVGSSRGRGRGRGRGGRGRGRGFAAAAAYSREGSRSEGSPIGKQAGVVKREAQCVYNHCAQCYWAFTPLGLSGAHSGGLKGRCWQAWLRCAARFLRRVPGLAKGRLAQQSQGVCCAASPAYGSRLWAVTTSWHHTPRQTCLAVRPLAPNPPRLHPLPPAAVQRACGPRWALHWPCWPTCAAPAAPSRWTGRATL